MEKHYPKTISIKGSVKVTIRPLAATDEEALLAFFRALPEESTLYLKDDVRDPDVVARFIRDMDPERVWCLLAFAGDRVVGNATLHMWPQGWRRHVGELRVVVSADFTKQGIATSLIRDLVNHASLRGLRKMEAQILDSQRGALQAFQKLGFQEEARLREHALGHDDQPHDLLILTNSVADLWRKMEDLMMEMDVRGNIQQY